MISRDRFKTDLTNIKVSMLCPTYNRPLLAASLCAQMRSQSHENWELLLMHDGPGKETYDEVRPFLRDPRIKYSESKKRYGSWGFHLRNEMLSVASGDWIGFPSDDSTYVHRYLEIMLTRAIRDSADFVYCNIAHDGFIPEDGDFHAVHACYGRLVTYARNGHIDMSCFLINKKWSAGRRFDEKDYTADGIYVEKVYNDGAVITKYDGILNIHS